MKKNILRFLFLIFLLLFTYTAVQSQIATVTIYYSGAQAWGCCSVCGTDYMCIGSSGCGCCQPSQQTKTFIDPVPAGNYITNVKITYFAADCSASNVPTSLNGVSICAAVNPGTHTCACGSCNQATCNTNYPCGLTGYVYGGVNTLYANPAPNGTEICTQRVQIQLTYAPGSPGGPPIPGAITGPTTICPFQTYTYSITAVGGATSYTWTVPSGATINSGQGTTSISVTFGANGGNICVTATNTCGTSSPSCLTVTLGAAPATPGAITGPTTFCPGQTYTYSISAVAGATTYNWTVPAGSTINSGQGTTSISVTFGLTSGQICVTAQGPCGTSAASCLSVTLGAAPATPGTITGTTTFCPGQTYSYSISSVGGATSYTWTVPAGATINSGQGTTGISVTFGVTTGQICVTATGPCGTSAPSCLTVNLGSPPATPGAITGPTTFCPTQTFSYSISSVPGATTYTWTVPTGATINSGQGTTGISVTFGATPGQICVTATGPCGTSAASCLTINLGAAPNPPTSIAGSTSVCPGDVDNYTCSTVPGATSYNWTVPTGATINSGQGTSGVTITFGASSGSICVTVTTICGTSTPFCQPIIVNALPSVTNNPMTQTICSGQSSTLVVLTGSIVGTTFTWTSAASGGITGNTASGTSTIPVQTLTNSTLLPGTVIYTIMPISNGCPGTTSNYTITVNPTPTITNSPLTQTICSGSLLTITPTASVPGTSFSWTASCSSGNVTGFAASGTGNISSTLINNLSTAGTVAYVLTPVLNGCTGPPAIYLVTVNPSPTVTNSPLTLSICSGQSTNINLTGNIAGTTFSWTGANTTGTITGFSANGNGNINNTLTNSQTTPGVVTYTIAPTANGCIGLPVQFTVTVSQDFPVSVAIASNPGGPVCVGSVVVFTATPTNGGTGPAYQWQLNGVNVGTNNPTYTTNALPVGSNTITCTLTSNSNLCITGNPASTTYNITVNPLPDASINPSGPYCVDAAPVNLTAVNAGGTWSGNGITNTTTGLFDPATAGVGTHVITYNYTDPVTGCSNTGTLNFVVNPLPAVQFASLASVCVTAPAFPLTGGSPAGGTYSGPGVNNNTFTPSVAGAGTQTITYTYTDPTTNCTSFATQTLVVNAGFTVNITPAAPSICLGTCISIDVVGGDTYVWFPSTGLSGVTGGSVIACPQVTTTYTVNASNSSGCTGGAMVTVTVYPSIGVTFTTQPAMGCVPLDVKCESPSGPNWTDSTWHWNFGDIYSASGNTSILANPTHTYNYEGTYSITLSLTDMYGCIESGTQQIISHDKPIANFNTHPPDETSMDSPTVSFVNQSAHYDSLWWNFGDPNAGTNNFSIDEMPIHTYSDTGIYIVTLVALTNAGCMDTIQKPYDVYPSFVLFVPNAFTPNGDGLNETFKPSMIGIDPNNYSLQIYDRWGKRIFESADPSKGWDGRIGTTLGRQDVYTWILIVWDKMGNKYKQLGRVTLIN